MNRIIISVLAIIILGVGGWYYYNGFSKSPLEFVTLSDSDVSFLLPTYEKFDIIKEPIKDSFANKYSIYRSQDHSFSLMSIYVIGTHLPSSYKDEEKFLFKKELEEALSVNLDYTVSCASFETGLDTQEPLIRIVPIPHKTSYDYDEKCFGQKPINILFNDGKWQGEEELIVYSFNGNDLLFQDRANNITYDTIITDSFHIVPTIKK